MAWTRQAALPLGCCFLIGAVGLVKVFSPGDYEDKEGDTCGVLSTCMQISIIDIGIRSYSSE